MKSQRKQLITLLCLSVFPFFLFPVKSASRVFPVGLVLTYHVTEDAYDEWNERYEILRWAPEQGETILVMNFSSIKENTQLYLLFVDIST